MGTSREDGKFAGTLLMAPRVPQGLAAAVEGLTREVLRHRPPDIYVFAARHFEKLLKLREEYRSGERVETPLSEQRVPGLRELNDTIKRRDDHQRTPRIRAGGRDEVDRSGWSLNDTVKVLERYRSAFGDDDATAGIEEARALAKKARNTGRFGRSSSRSGSTSRSRSGRRSPKIISQMSALPGSAETLAEDIKSTLRRNKITDRERKRSKAANGGPTTNLENNALSRKAFAKRSAERNLAKENGLCESSAGKKSSRALSMDRVVKDYAVGRFASAKSLEELQSANYVEKVQRVIHQTAPIIRDRVEELKSVAFGRARGTSNNSSAEAGAKNFEVESRRNDSMEGIDTLESESACSEVLEARDTLEARLNATQHLLRDISATCRQNSKSRPVSPSSAHSASTSGSAVAVRRPKSAKDEFSAAETSAERSTNAPPEDLPKVVVSLPAVRPASSRASKDASRNDSDLALVLPPISPETSKSSKRSDDLVLPALSPPTELTLPNDQSTKRDSDEEVSRDSLNVTPDVLADAPQRPDSLEPDDSNLVATETDKDRANINVRDKLRELEDAEKRIDGILNREIYKQPPSDEIQRIDDENVTTEAENEGQGTHEDRAASVTNVSADDGSSGDSRETRDDSCDHGKTDIPFSYVLSEGSPCEIPESVTTVIIPERTAASPESIDDQPDEPGLKAEIEAFGEYVTAEPIETSTIDIDFIHALKARHDFPIARQDLDQIREEEDDREVEEIDNLHDREETSVKDNPTLEDILEREEREEREDAANEESLKKVEIAREGNGSSRDVSPSATASDSTDEAKETSSLTDAVPVIENLAENSAEAEESTEPRSAESSNEVKETTVSDRSTLSLSFDPHSRPLVPELNLDSLQDITVSSFKITDDEMERRESEETATTSDRSSFDENKRPTATEEPHREGDLTDEEIARMLIQIDRADGKDEQSVGSVDGDEETTDLPKDREEPTNQGKTERVEAEEENDSLAISRSVSQCTTRRVPSANEEAIAAEESSSRKIDESQTEAEGEPEENGRGESKDSMISASAEIIDSRTLSEVPATPTDCKSDEEKINEEKERDEISVSEKLAESNAESLESGIINSALIKIQAGVRGFLTRQRLRNLRSADESGGTLAGIPSIPDGSPPPPPPPLADPSTSDQGERTESSTPETNDAETKVKPEKISQGEDAPRTATVSCNMEKAFAANGIQHTGEFHDCLPLPLPPFDQTIDRDSSEETTDATNDDETRDATKSQESDTLFDPAAVPALQLAIDPSALPFIDLLTVGRHNDETVLENRYLNFITSVEDAEARRIDGEWLGKEEQRDATFRESAENSGQDISLREPLALLTDSPQGVIIEELTSASLGDSDKPAHAERHTSGNSRETEKNVEEEKECIGKDESTSPDAASPCSIDDERAFLESSPISLEDPSSVNVSRVSSAKASDRSNGKPDNALSLDSTDQQNLPSVASVERPKDAESSNDRSIPPEASLSTLSFSMDIDDALGLTCTNETAKTRDEPSPPSNSARVLAENSPDITDDENAVQEEKEVSGEATEKV